ncbi:hypothetical protein PILCRDRAFT_645918 [Piloderma croceum F 1598]|uniref:Uncharacterized protein n=1 Tax=Piloderma croceum (strain F 1598) TaxID=765440 RepID=A0A0C3F9Y1_PILCF|nr:hypothetical protein PILCRDRAFT_645918 [Piloderma croceum F 1598]
MFEVQLDGQTSWILTDRSAGGRNSTLSPSPSNSRTDLGVSSSSNTAYDRIVVPAFGKHDTILLWINDDPVTACSLKIRSNVSFSLADLAGLLPLVAAQATNYNPFAKQCYWYARAVYESIKRKYPSEETRGDAYDRRGKHAKLLPVPCKVSENELKLIQGAWLTRIEEIAGVETISQMRENTRSAEDRARTAEERLQHERCAAEESKRAAEESKRAAEESKRAAEESKRAAEESKCAALKSETDAEQAKRNEANAREAVEEERRNTEEARRNEEEARRNEEEARRNEAEEKRKCLELEAELREMRKVLKP